MSNEPKINKTTAYLAAAGAFATGAFLLTAAPFVTIPLVVAAGVAVAVRKDREAFLGRVKNETQELVKDLTTHASKDLKGLSKWWSRISSKAEKAAQAQTPVQQPADTQSNFKSDATAKADFGQNAAPKPAAEAPQAAPAAAPAAEVKPPKAPGQ